MTLGEPQRDRERANQQQQERQKDERPARGQLEGDERSMDLPITGRSMLRSKKIPKKFRGVTAVTAGNRALA
jgi:hypothetical protein